jgi:hypothetical protein
MRIQIKADCPSPHKHTMSSSDEEFVMGKQDWVHEDTDEATTGTDFDSEADMPPPPPKKTQTKKAATSNTKKTANAPAKAKASTASKGKENNQKAPAKQEVLGDAQAIKVILEYMNAVNSVNISLCGFDRFAIAK